MEKDFDKCLRDTFHIIASEISVSDSEKIKKCIDEKIRRKSKNQNVNEVKSKEAQQFSNLPDDGKRKKAVVRQTLSMLIDRCGGFEQIKAAVFYALILTTP